MKIKKNIIPLRDNVLVSDMDFGFEQTKTGIVLMSDDGKTQGIHPRWGKVWAIGPDQKDIKIGDWICVEHGRWTRTIEVELENETIELRMVDTKAILIVADEKPDSIMRAN